MNDHKLSPVTIEDHVNKAPESIKGTLNLLRTKIKELENVQEYATRAYIGYKLKAYKTLFVEMHIQTKKEQIVLHLKPVEYNDPDNKIFLYPYVPKWPLRSGINITNEEELDYALPFIKESYKAVVELL